MPGQNLAGGLWRERYLSTIVAARDFAGDTLPVDLVIPVWWGTHPEWGDLLLDRLIDLDISLTIMNYRTDYDRLLAGAVPYLNWGNQHQVPVRIALETGTLRNETRRVYTSVVDAGELWSIRIGSSSVLVLFNAIQQGLSGKAYSLQQELEFSASNLTFAGDQPGLKEMSNRLMEELGDWSSFAGMALHGLEEVYAK